MSKYDFALQWLDYLDIEVYNKGKRILEYDGDPNYQIERLKTGVNVGQELGEEEDEIEFTELSYPELLNLGYVVVSESNSSYFWRKHQRCYYVLKKKARTIFGIPYESYRKTASQTSMSIQHDPTHKRIRLVGENVLADPRLRRDSGIGWWIIYDEDAPRVVVKRKKVALTKEAYRQKIKGEGNDGPEFMPIKEIPLLLSDERLIVCMPKEDICQRLLVTGAARKGKSTFCNGVAGRVHKKWEERVGWLIDVQNQFYDISAPQDNPGFIKIMELLNEEPQPIPALQLYLACKYPGLIQHENISLKLTVDFHEFLNKLSYYANGIKEWNLEGAARYFKGVIPIVKKARNIKEFNELCYVAIPEANEKKKDNLKSMIFKWKNTFNSIFLEKFTSNLYVDDPLATDKLKIKFPDNSIMEGHPFIMAMEAGLVPVINISTVPDKPWVRNYLADLMDKIVLHQKSQIQLKKFNRKWIVVDEMQAIYEEKSGKKKDNATMAFEALFRQGGFNGIGGIYNTQSLEKLNKEMVKNATHICCVYTQSKKERNMIKDIFELPNEIVAKLSTLKVQEMMVFSNEPFVVYDKWGRRKVVTDKRWFKGKIIPPINYHKGKVGG